MMAAARAGIDPELAGDAGDEAGPVLKHLARAAVAASPDERAQALDDARAEFTRFDAVRYPALAQMLAAKLGAPTNTSTDSDVIVPDWVHTPELLAKFVAAQTARGVDHHRIRFPNSNPATGVQEFFGPWDRAKDWMKSQDWLQDASRTGFRGLAAVGRVAGLDLAADHLDHFLDASGEPLKVDPARLWSDPTMIATADKIKKKFEQGLIGPKVSTEFGDLSKLDTLKPGESFNLPGSAHASDSAKLREAIFNEPLDKTLAIGRHNLDGRTDFTATRGDKQFNLDGRITYTLNEPYDFESDYPGAGIINTLRDTGRAKEFRTQSQWAQDVVGTIELDEHGRRKKASLERGAPYRLPRR